MFNKMVEKKADTWSRVLSTYWTVTPNIWILRTTSSWNLCVLSLQWKLHHTWTEHCRRKKWSHIMRDLKLIIFVTFLRALREQQWLFSLVLILYVIVCAEVTKESAKNEVLKRVRSNLHTFENVAHKIGKCSLGFIQNFIQLRNETWPKKKDARKDGGTAPFLEKTSVITKVKTKLNDL